MRTFNDLLEVGENEANRMQFVYEAINEHKSSDLYKTAQIADEYDRKQNRTIVQFQKLLYDATGRAIPDNVSANYKITSGFFNRFTTQQVQFLLGNGVTWEDETTKDYLGEDFDKQLQVAAKASLGAGVSFGFYNYDHLEVFTALEYVPLYDEENGGYRIDAYNIAFTGFIDNSNSDLVCFCGADEVPADRKVTYMFHDIMQAAVDRYNIVAL